MRAAPTRPVLERSRSTTARASAPTPAAHERAGSGQEAGSGVDVEGSARRSLSHERPRLGSIVGGRRQKFGRRRDADAARDREAPPQFALTPAFAVPGVKGTIKLTIFLLKPLICLRSDVSPPMG